MTRSKNVPDEELLEELVLVARVNFDYPEATVDNVKRVKVGKRKYFALELQAEMTGIRDMPRDDEVLVPVSTFIVEPPTKEKK